MQKLTFIDLRAALPDVLSQVTSNPGTVFVIEKKRKPVACLVAIQVARAHYGQLVDDRSISTRELSRQLPSVIKDTLPNGPASVRWHGERFVAIAPYADFDGLNDTARGL